MPEQAPLNNSNPTGLLMKTVTIKLPEDQARDLDHLVKESKSPSKSEFIRQLIADKLRLREREKQGWQALAEKSLEKIWKNKHDDEVWSKYL